MTLHAVGIATITALVLAAGPARALDVLAPIQTVGTATLPHGAAASPDGNHVYVALGDPFVAADEGVGVYSRDPGTGLLTPVETEPTLGSDQRAVVVSPGGAHVYSGGGLVVTAFTRNAGTGALTFLQQEQVLPGPTVSPVSALALSPGGEHLYVVSDRLTVLARNAGTGALTFVEEHTGLGEIEDVAVSPDGAYVYVARSGPFPAAVQVFSRDAGTGALTLVRSENMTGKLIGHVPTGLALSPDGGQLYVESRNKPALLVFRRTISNGYIRLAQTVLYGAAFGDRRVDVSADGAHVFSTGDSGFTAFARNPINGRVQLLETEVVPGDAHSALPPDGAHVYTSEPGASELEAFSVDPCSPIVSSTRVRLQRIGTDVVPGNDRFKIAGQVQLRDGSFADLDPLADGLRVIVEAAGGTPRVDVTLPGGAYAGRGTAGWKLNGSGTRWSFVDRTGAPANGIDKVKITDRSKRLPSLVALAVSGRNGTYPVVAGDEPVAVRLVLDATGRCAVTAFTPDDCRFNGAGNTLACRSR
jgi:DNA-binding beta-propeller fold protein YncE